VPPLSDGPGLPAPERFDTPGTRTIEDLAKDYDLPGERQIKTLVYVLDGRLTLVLLRGDHDLMEQKLVDTAGAVAIRPAHPEEIRAALGALPGSLGAVGVTDLPIIGDVALRGRRDMATGANVNDVHVRGVDVERDIVTGRWADLRQVKAGEPCSRCGQPLAALRAVEIGHIFKLGYKFTEALNITVLAPNGERVAPIMGSYGVGVERAMAAIVEQHHDEAGIVWPLAVAPFTVAIVPIGAAGDTASQKAEELYEQLTTAGIEVLYDDRDERPGVKFRDVELIGIPFYVAVGSRGLAKGVVEVTVRDGRRKVEVPAAGAAKEIVEMVRAAAELPADR
jgi:prolyl-tRNA synthetase